MGVSGVKGEIRGADQLRPVQTFCFFLSSQEKGSSFLSINKTQELHSPEPEPRLCSFWPSAVSPSPAYRDGSKLSGCSNGVALVLSWTKGSYSVHLGAPPSPSSFFSHPWDSKGSPAADSWEFLSTISAYSIFFTLLFLLW